MLEIIILLLGAAIGKATEQVIVWYINARNPNKIPRLLKIDDIVAWGWRGERLLRDLIRIDKILLGNTLTTEAREGTVSQWAPVFMKHTEGWAILAVRKKIVGYFSFFALSEEAFLKAKEGKLLDCEVTIENTIALDTPGNYKAYFVLLAAFPEFPRAGVRLIDAFFDQLENLAERGVLFEEMIANAFTPSGKRICEGFGMEKVCNHADFGEIFSIRFNPWPTRLDYKKWASLKALYEKNINAFFIS
jgi:hypothetical protein